MSQALGTCSTFKVVPFHLHDMCRIQLARRALQEGNPADDLARSPPTRARLSTTSQWPLLSSGRLPKKSPSGEREARSTKYHQIARSDWPLGNTQCIAAPWTSRYDLLFRNHNNVVDTRVQTCSHAIDDEAAVQVHTQSKLDCYWRRFQQGWIGNKDGVPGRWNSQDCCRVTQRAASPWTCSAGRSLEHRKEKSSSHLKHF